MSYDLETGAGLRGIYANLQPKATEWKEMTIQNFPAVASVTPAAGNPGEFCGVSIGVTDKETVDVTVFLGRNKSDGAKPCDVAPQVAELVVTTLQEKAGA